MLFKLGYLFDELYLGPDGIGVVNAMLFQRRPSRVGISGPIEIAGYK